MQLWLLSVNSAHHVPQFLLEMFKAPVATLEESTSKTAHFVNPADLATRILALRCGFLPADPHRISW